MHLHHILDIAGCVVIGASALLNFLPTADKFADWPRFQGWYKFFMVFLTSVALNGKQAIDAYNNATQPKAKQFH